MKTAQKSKKPAIAIAVIFVVLTVTIILLVNQNFILTRSNEELLKSYSVLMELNEELTARVTNLTSELQAFQENYSRLRLWSGETNPKVQTRLGATVIERYDTKDNYLWVTGEVQNDENVTIYDAKLNFTLYTYNGVDESQILIGTMQPQQVVTIRTTVMTQLKGIINWTIEPSAKFISFE